MSYTQQELDAIRAEYAKGATDTQFTNFIREAEERNLVPGRHIYFSTRRSREYDSETGSTIFVNRAVTQTSIDALRLIAQRSGEYQGQDKPIYIYLDKEGTPSIRSTSILPEEGSTKKARIPWEVEVSVYRKNFVKPITVTARFDSYAVTYKDKATGKQELNDMWSRRGPEQLAKCAEALSLRKGFPEELSGLYIAEELQNQEEAPKPETSPEPVTAPPAVAVPEVNQVPATPTDAPRPEPKKRGRKPKAVATEEAQTMPIAAESAPVPHSYEATDDDLPVELFKPAPDEALPTEEQRHDFVSRARALVAILSDNGVENPSSKLKAYITQLTKITDTKNLTVGQWNTVLNNLEGREHRVIVGLVGGEV